MSVLHMSYGMRVDENGASHRRIKEWSDITVQVKDCKPRPQINLSIENFADDVKSRLFTVATMTRESAVELMAALTHAVAVYDKAVAERAGATP